MKLVYSYNLSLTDTTDNQIKISHRLTLQKYDDLKIYEKIYVLIFIYHSIDRDDHVTNHN